MLNFTNRMDLKRKNKYLVSSTFVSTIHGKSKKPIQKQ